MCSASSRGPGLVGPALQGYPLTPAPTAPGTCTPSRLVASPSRGGRSTPPGSRPQVIGGSSTLYQPRLALAGRSPSHPTPPPPVP